MALAWCFEDEASERAEAVLTRLEGGETVMVPSIWGLEVANALVVAERRGRLSQAQAVAFVALLQALPIAPEDLRLPDREGLMAVARSHRLSVYDAAYLHLAERRALRLATLGSRLARAASSAGVALV